MHKERLLRLADKLDGSGPYEKVGPVPTKKFYMGTWLDEREADLKKAKRDKAGFITEIPCGTAACACGWAAVDPWFRKRGFKLAFSYFNTCPDFQGVRADEAAKTFFDLHHGGFSELFVDDGTPKQVAKRIRQFVKEHES